MTTVAFPVKNIRSIDASGPNLMVEAEMTERQMFATLMGFLQHVTDDDWSKWQRDINAECYGETA